MVTFIAAYLYGLFSASHNLLIYLITYSLHEAESFLRI
jgi:hypothetical protein